MNPINNSDTAWLIVTDYNQDNNLPYEDLREDILNPEINQWVSEHVDRQVGSTESTFESTVSCVGDGYVVLVGGEWVGEHRWIGTLVGCHFDWELNEPD